MTRTSIFAAATAAALTAVLVTSGPAVAAPRAHHSRASIPVHVTSKHHVIIAKTTRPGLADVRNTGSRDVLLVTPRHSAGAAALAKDLNADTAAGLIKDFYAAATVPGKGHSFVRLSRRTYYLADLSADTIRTATIARLRVSGATTNAAAPKSTAVTVSKHDTVSGPATLSTTSELRFTNSSSHLHELDLVGVAKNVSAAELQKFLAKPSIDTLGRVSTSVVLLSLLSPGKRVVTSNHSASGRYLLITFEFTSHTSEPHLVTGQARLITIK